MLCVHACCICCTHGIHYVEPYCMVYMTITRGLPGGASGKEPICQCRRCKTRVPSLSLEDPPGGGNANPLPYSCLENSRQRSLVGCNPWGCKESDTTERLSTHTYDCMHCFTSYHGLPNGTPEKERDRPAPLQKPSGSTLSSWPLPCAQDGDQAKVGAGRGPLRGASISSPLRPQRIQG